MEAVKLCSTMPKMINFQMIRAFHRFPRILSNQNTRPIKVNGETKISDLYAYLEEFAPLKLAETWDNVGTLIEPGEKKFVSKVLLTNDLTEPVVDEAIKNNTDFILTYHPCLFRPIKSVTNSQWKERNVIRCIKNNITVFSPHTSWDNTRNGMCDWLCSIFTGDIKPIVENPDIPGAGTGRICHLREPTSLNEALKLVRLKLNLPNVQAAVAVGKDKQLLNIKSVAVCPGSGFSVLNNAPADLYVSGEMSHHEVLDVIHSGVSVILTNHSNSERGFLSVFQRLLKSKFPGLEVLLSKTDEDPLKSYSD